MSVFLCWPAIPACRKIPAVSANFAIYGEDLDVDALLAVLTPPPEVMFRKGSPRRRSKPAGELHPSSKLLYDVSEAAWNDQPQQIRDAMDFLPGASERIRRIVGFPGLESAGFSFPIDHVDQDDPTTLMDWSEPLVTVIPANFIAAVGSLGIFAEFTHYSYRMNEDVERSDLHARLRIEGPEPLLENKALPVDRRWEGGVSFRLSAADEHHFKDQQKDACAFLEKWSGSLREVTALPAVQAVLEFPIQFRDALANTTTLAPDFLKAAAQAGIGVELVHYPVMDV